MRIATGVTVWNDAVGKRMSIMYSEIDDTTGKIISDNNRIDRVVTDQSVRAKIDAVMEAAQSYVDSL